MNEQENKENTEKKKSKKGIIFVLLFLLLLLLSLFLLNKFFGIGNILKGEISERLRDRNGAEIIEIEKRELKKDEVAPEEGEVLVPDEDVTQIDEELMEGEEAEKEIISTEEDFEIDVTIKTSDEERIEIEDDGYSVHQISFGNSVVVDNDEVLGVPLKIESIESEAMESLSGEGVNAVITWVTTKSSISELVYSKKDGGGGGSVREKSYGISHAAFIEGLDENEDYIFNIKVRSKNNQATESGYMNFRTDVESVFVSSVKDTFRSLFGL